MTAMSKISWLLVLLPALWLAGQCPAAEDERVLYVYTWENYFDPEVVRDFEQANKCRVDFDYFDSYDTMFERIRYGETGYDIITPAANLAAELDRQGLLMNLNRRLIPNLRHLETTRLLPFPDLEMRYHAPYTWSIVVIGYNKAKLAGEAPGSWDIFARDGFANRASMMNDPRYVVGAALKYLGYSLNSADPGEIERAGETLRLWKRNIALLDVNRPLGELKEGKLDFVQAFSGDMGLAEQEDPDLRFYIPREGSILNSDVFVVPVDAEQPDLAHAFINHMFNPRMAARNMESIMYYMPNRAAVAQLRPEFRNHPCLFFPPEDIARSEAIRDAGAGAALYEKAWMDFLIEGGQ